jgi:competence protein ComEC
LFPGGGRARRALLLTALTAVTVLVITARPTLLARPARTLTVSVIDVGQGDAILLQFPDDVSMLIDAGPRSPAFDSGRKVVAPLLGRFGVDRLTYLVLTHPHNDHVGGVGGVLRSVQADTVLASTWIDPGGRAIPFRQLAAGASFSPTTDSRVYVLWPDTPRPPGGRSPFATANNRSLILKVVYGGFSILLTGDGEAAVERPIADRYGVFIRSTVLKVGHHGSSSSSSERFLRQVRPELAVISVGTLNSFGHPSTEVLGRLAALPCDVRRTDREGCVMIRTDGRTWERVVWRD